MNTIYLVDYENINNDERLKNIESLPETDQVHIFFTEDTPKINTRYAFLEIVKGHEVLKVKNGKKAEIDAQALDKHLVSYLGYLLGVYEKEYAYVIVSEDIGYDNIIKFWKDEGYPNISRKEKIPETSTNQKTAQSVVTTTTYTANSKISEGMAYDFSGEDRSELYQFMQRGLIAMGYSINDANGICEFVVAHCNDERILSKIHNDLKEEYNNYRDIYKDVKTILKNFNSQDKNFKRESQVRSFFGEHFKKKIYTDNREKILEIIINAKTKQQINNGLMKLYADGNVVKDIYQTIQPLIKDLPGK